MTGGATAPRLFGIVEWFRPGDHDRVEEMLPRLLQTGATSLRTHISWADYLGEGGEAWFDWLLPKLGGAIDLLPCVHYTPPSLSRNGRSSGAPRVLKDYADFVDHLLTRHGRHFSHVELWNEPNNLLDWDWRDDPDCLLFCEMVGGAAYWAKRRGFKPVLAGPCPFDSRWLDLMGQRGILDVVDAAGFHGFPGTWDSEAGAWRGWDAHLAEMRSVLDRYNPRAEIWITETGFSTWRNDEIAQAQHFLDALAAPAARMYWYGYQDVPADVPVQEGLWFDARHYHLGLCEADGAPKLLARLLAEGGVEKVADIVAHRAPMAAPAVGRPAHPVTIVGGAGFIGCNLAESFLREGRDVVVVDNLSRAGVDQNLAYLRDRYGAYVHPHLADIRDAQATRATLADAGAVFHLAAQTAVTTSLDRPREDFAVNAQGTFNVLEAVRLSGRRVPVVFASTNKVYGALADLAMDEQEDRYVPRDDIVRLHGIGEARPLDFCTPYGCSKGVADQYVLDYAKSFGVPGAVLRMSCIYGPHQFGTEDQGWVAHFLIQALRGAPISIYGDGKQVRDVLHVHDAVAAYRAVHASIDAVQGRAFNLGGGSENAISLRMLLQQIARLHNRPVDVSYSHTRAGDQLFFVADTRAIGRTLGWAPQIGWRDGVRDLSRWLADHRVDVRAEVARIGQPA